MLHRRTSSDAVPLVTANLRRLRAVRRACDDAPATDGATVVVVTFESQVGIRILDLDFVFEMQSLIEARGPPCFANIRRDAPDPAPSFEGTAGSCRSYREEAR